MAREWGSDGGDSFNTSKIFSDFDYVFTDGNADVVSGITGASGNCIRMSSGLGILSCYLRTNLSTNAIHKIAGVRYRIDGLPGVGYVPVISFWDGAAASNTTLYVSADGRLSVWRGAGTARTTQIGTPSDAALVHTATMIHIGFDLVWATSGGSFTVYANSKSVITASGAQTAENDSGIGMFSIWSGTTVSNGASGGQAYFDDAYVNNTTGSQNNGFDGDIQALAIFPVGAGVFTQQTIAGSSPAATNWQSVNETSPDDGVTMVTAATTGLKDTYKLGTVPSNVASIVCVDAILDAQCDTAGLGLGAQIAPLFGPGTTSVVQGTPVSINTNWQRRRQSYGLNPITTSAWVKNDFNSGTPLEGGHIRTT